MKALKLKSAALAMTFLVAFTLVDYASSSPAPIGRLDLFDVQGNNLMFVVFEYGPDGNNTAYSVYFSDSTFTRRVVVGRNSSGLREKETAYNFTEDTVFNTTFTQTGDKTDMVVKDQFKVNQFDGTVTYSKTSALEFAFVNGSYSHKITYEYDATGRMQKVNIFGGDGNLAYYGLFDYNYIGVLSPMDKHSSLFSSISLRGDNTLAWKFTLDRASKIKCEAMSLTGRRVAVLYSGNLPAGNQSKIIRLGSAPTLTNGVYVAVMSIDDKPVAKTKFIVQRIRGGVK